MIAENCQTIGKIIKTHGINGELILATDKDIDNDLLKTELVFFLIDELPVPFFISSIKEKSSTSAIIHFEDLNSIEDSEEYIGVQVCLPHKKKKRKKISAELKESIIGYTVIDKNHGQIGIVTNIIIYPENPLLEVKKEKYEYLIPIHDDIISDIDDVSKCLHINAPEGLLDL
jgi:16S rRNA processing protein RimM